jgi:group I intron endonuclease
MIFNISNDLRNLSGVYTIRCSECKRIYIGSAVNLKRRFTVHLKALLNNRHHCSKLQKAFNEFGKECFTFSLLEICEKTDVLKREQFWIDSTKELFNSSRSAYSLLGYKHTEESKSKISKANVGIKKTEAHRRKISEFRTGSVMSDEVRLKISKSCGNKSGYVGVHYHSKNKKWVAQAYKNGKRKYLGIYDSPELANEARLKFMEEPVCSHH